MQEDFSHLAAIWKYPTRIRFGAGCLSELGEVLAECGISRPLVVTDQAMAELGIWRKLMEQLQQMALDFNCFTDIRPNPVGSNIEAGAECFKQGEHDGILAFGGGSAMDAAKAIAFQSAQTEPFFSLTGKEGRKRAFSEGIPPVITLPTTAGTGSEASYAAVIIEEETRNKHILSFPAILPRMALCDPLLTLDLPGRLTAATGMDALCHALEALCVREYHPMADGIALEAIALIDRWLPAAFADGHDVTARSHLMAASIMGAAAFQKGLGAVHALSHPISARMDSHHGLTNAVLLPYVLRFNREAVEDRTEILARRLGLENPGFNSLFDHLLTLRQTLRIPASIRDIGLDMTQADQIAEAALADPTAAHNPVPLTQAKLWAILENAWDGRIS